MPILLTDINPDAVYDADEIAALCNNIHRTTVHQRIFPCVRTQRENTLMAEEAGGRLKVFVGKHNLDEIMDQVTRQQKGFVEHNVRSSQESRILADRASELRDQKWTIAEIAAEVGRSKKQVTRYLKDKKEADMR